MTIRTSESSSIRQYSRPSIIYFLLQFLLISLLPCYSQSPNINWTFLKGEGYLPYYPNYGTVGVESSRNNIASREGVVTWTLDGKLYLFGGTGKSALNSGYLNDLWVFDPASTNWTWLKGSKTVPGLGYYGTQGVAAEDNTPGGRTHALAWQSGGKLYLFGGYGISGSISSGILNDLWEYDPKSNNWKWLKGSSAVNQVGSRGALGETLETNAPNARQDAASWEDNGKLYLFGGYGRTSTNATNFNDLWEYNTATNNWTWIHGPSTPQPPNYGTLGVGASTNLPGARRNTHSFKINNTFYIFGGNGLAASTAGYLNDLWEYSPETNQWRWIKGPKAAQQPGLYGSKGEASALNVPGAREFGSYWTSGGKIYVFGGYGMSEGTSGYLNDLWEFDPITANWKWIKGEKGPNMPGNYGTEGIVSESNQPGSRKSAGAWELNGKLYLFGGIASSGSLYDSPNDLWEFKLTSSNWTWIKGASQMYTPVIYGEKNVYAEANSPGSRSGAVNFSYQGNLYLFGGRGDASNTYGELNDLWIYSPESNNWKWLSGSNSASIIYPPPSIAVYGIKGVADAGNTPGRRTDAVGWAVESKFYMFGGREREGSTTQNQFDDLWLYDIPANTWAWITGSSTSHQPPVYGTRNMAAAENTPGARAASATWVYNGKLYLFGGFHQQTTAGFIYNDLWEYDPTTNLWKWISGSNLTDQYGIYGTLGESGSDNAPGGRFNASTWIYGSKLYLFGGIGLSKDTKGLLNDLWEFDLSTSKWRWVKGSDKADDPAVYGTKNLFDSENHPSARSASQSWLRGDKLYLFGGYRNKENVSDCYNDIWEFDLKTNNWRWIDGSSSINPAGFYTDSGETSDKNNIGGRFDANAWFINDHIYVFGGTGIGVDGDNNIRGDLWRGDINTVLPLHLIEFSAKKEGTFVKLFWKTDLKENTTYVIERSADGKSFESIGTLKNHPDQIIFQFNDQQPNSGLNIYRLSNLENDGVKFLALTSTDFQLDNNAPISLYPNPFSEQFTVAFKGRKNQIVELELVDFSGKTMQTNRFITDNEGLNSYKINHTDNIPSGAYIIRIKMDNFIQSSVIIKR